MSHDLQPLPPQQLPQHGAAPQYPGYPGYSGYGATGQPMHLWDYWAIVLKRLWLVLLFVAVCLGIAWFVTKNQAPQYRATAIIEIKPPSVASKDQFSPVILSDDRYLETQLDKLRMPLVLENAIRKAELSGKPGFQGRSDRDIAGLVHDHIDVSRRHDKYLIEVSVKGPEPLILHPVANALVQEFRVMQISETQLRREARKAEVDGRVQQKRSEKRIVEADKRQQLELKNFNEHQFHDELELLQSRRLNLTKQRDELQYYIFDNEPAAQQFEKTLAEAQKAGPAGVELLQALPRIALDSEVRRVNERLAGLRDDHEAILKRGNKLDPEIAVVERQIERLEAERRRIITSNVENFLQEFRGKQVGYRLVSEQYDKVTGTVTELLDLRSKIDRYDDQIKSLESELAAALSEYEILTQQQPTEAETVSVSQPAVEPRTPYAPNWKNNMVFGAILGIVGGLALAFLLDYLDDTVRTKDELAKIADVPLLGVVPRIAGGGGDTEKKDLFAHAQPKSTISEAYRGVRTALTLSANARRQKVLLLTSAGPREGKTTTSINLATVLAYAGGRTLLIDADLRKPRIHRSFDVPNVRGLTNAIINGDDPLHYCQKTICEGVDVLPSGPIPPNPSELLGHPRMKEIITRLREHYDHIVVDTPPIGAVTDAAVLATVCDGVILVVHAGKTRRQIVSRGLEQLRYINANIVGVILNNLRIGRARYYPGYSQYYYYYSHYGAEDAPPEPPEPPPMRPAQAS